MTVRCIFGGIIIFTLVFADSAQAANWVKPNADDDWVWIDLKSVQLKPDGTKVFTMHHGKDPYEPEHSRTEYDFSGSLNCSTGYFRLTNIDGIWEKAESESYIGNGLMRLLCSVKH